LKKLTKEHIESYIFTPDLLSKEKKLEIEQLLKESDELRAVASWYRLLKKEIRYVEKSKSKKRPESSRIKLIPSKVIKKKKHSFTLAAKTVSAHKRKPSLLTLRTFISEENKALVRVMRNSDESQIQVHAISENIDTDDIAMIRIPGVSDLMISKPGGVFLLKKGQYSDEAVKNWESCTLYIPMDRADLLLQPQTGNVFLDTHRTDKEQLSLSILEEADQVKIDVECFKDFQVDKVIVSNGQKGYLLLVNEGQINLPKTLINNRVTSLFFFN
jgi:hypothetical protein